jgi:hypothetical protein
LFWHRSVDYPQAGISICVPGSERFEAIVATLKLAVATLRDAEVPFVLAGSFAAWARGGPEPQKDLDLMLKPEHAQAALEALVRAGMRPERPPEEWLLKAWHEEVMVDLIFCPAGLEMTDEVFERAESMPVMSVQTPVMALEDVLITKLYALDEHSLDFTQLLGIARALREQIDWRQLRARTSDSAYAKAFFTLVTELGVAPSAAPPHGAPARAHPRVRVVPEG